ncbi:thiamine diphosphokinase [Aureimonas glaciei]|uniref:Thiamine diphosphokinase n=1 Tax=Aureimonas glaciei TaxID=1776957 RepID=A0A916YBH1_9HYPH|nr:thiamine diphosphokinase [Aureimonas glaciei]GGD38385.1 thiamine pyrophosphokinase [Aureimonas glaciei]
MSRFTILLAGAIRPTPALRQALAGSRIIAADGGMAHAETLGVVPELWVGDFDSAPAALAARFAAVPRETFARDKDRTDGELAIDAAIARGARTILLVGALGGPRTDHAFMHLILALRYAARGIDMALFDGTEHALPLRLGSQRIDMQPGTDFSLLKFSDLSGLSIAGARWPLDDVALPFESILTQSNQALGPIEITLRQGRAILVFQADPASA